MDVPSAQDLSFALAQLEFFHVCDHQSRRPGRLFGSSCSAEFSHPLPATYMAASLGEPLTVPPHSQPQFNCMHTEALVDLVQGRA